jgi:hypothetical protein
MANAPIAVERLSFTFDSSVAPFQYEVAGQCVDGWPRGAKIIDVVAHDRDTPPDVTWLMEAKDYRIITNPPRPTNLAGLAATVESKVRDSLAAFPVVGQRSTDPAARSHASISSTSRCFRVVLHLEPHPQLGAHAALFPVNWAANILLQLQSRVSDIDPSPLVLNIARTPASQVPWSVA